MPLSQDALDIIDPYEYLPKLDQPKLLLNATGDQFFLPDSSRFYYDDLVGETRPHNLPGRVVDGLWSRRLRQPTSEILAEPDVCRRLSILGRITP